MVKNTPYFTRGSALAVLARASQRASAAASPVHPGGAFRGDVFKTVLHARFGDVGLISAKLLPSPQGRVSRVLRFRRVLSFQLIGPSPTGAFS